MAERESVNCDGQQEKYLPVTGVGRVSRRKEAGHDSLTVSRLTF